MRHNQTSLTAMGIAVLRGVESEKPADERILYDPYARRLVPGWLYSMTKFFITTGYAEWRGPGVNGFLVARDRYIDDFLEERLKEGIDQLVILGAGYDARAYRFADLPGRVRTFEVDHPATQKDKLAALQKVFGQVPRHVTYVGIDFTSQSLEERLLACGYNPALKTIFIWQGVTHYLDLAAVDSTLALIARRSGPGSQVIFDYMDPSLLKEPGSHGEVKGMRRYRGMTGEALRFGLPINQVEGFLQARGFSRIHNVCSQELKPLYFTGKNQSRQVVAGYGIVSAVVDLQAPMRENG
jgi:methyltransferase (TIGR00027 family)